MTDMKIENGLEYSSTDDNKTTSSADVLNSHQQKEKSRQNCDRQSENKVQIKLCKPSTPNSAKESCQPSDTRKYQHNVDEIPVQRRTHKNERLKSRCSQDRRPFAKGSQIDEQASGYYTRISSVPDIGKATSNGSSKM